MGEHGQGGVPVPGPVTCGPGSGPGWCRPWPRRSSPRLPSARPATAVSSGRVTGRGDQQRKKASSSWPFSPGCEGPAHEQVICPRAARADERPVVEPGALGAVGAAQPLPPVLRDQSGRLVRPHPAGRAIAATSLQATAMTYGMPLLLQPSRAGPGCRRRPHRRWHPGERDPLPPAPGRSSSPPDRRLRRDADLVAHSRGPAAVPVLDVHFSGRYSSRSISARPPSGVT